MLFEQQETTDKKSGMKICRIKKTFMIPLFSIAIVFLVYSKIFQQNEENFAENNLDTITFKLKQCNCLRTLKVNKTNEIFVPFNETTCGIDAYRRGPGQKIVGFSLYGGVNSTVDLDKGYFEGIVENLKSFPEFYPGWIMRLYYDVDKTNDPALDLICQVACENSNLDLCDAKNLPGNPMKDASKIFPMNWRFFPPLDPQVSLCISRDLDSRFSEREFVVVQDWLKSDKDFHIIRDHPMHGTTILGGTWGSKLHNQQIRENWKKSWAKGLKSQITWAKRSEKGPDQVFLQRFVWNWAKDHSIAHDSYLCTMYPNTQPFPIRRRNESNNFVAAVFIQKQYIWQECPKKCRPKNHTDWLQC